MFAARGERFSFSLRELSGAVGNPRTLLPLLLGTVAALRVSPQPALLGIAVFCISAGI